jgi:membrane protein DedA with SNARE-associated domain
MQSFVQHYGYLALIVLSIAESACVPIPSEVTFGFAGALCTSAVTGTTHFSVLWVIVIGTLGSVVGSVIAYEVGRSLGRTVVERWGKWVLLTHDDLDTAERWFARYGNVSVLVGRVVPVVRTVISFPAGVAEMRRGPFLALTALGAAVWVSALTGLGYAAGSNWTRVSHDVHLVQWPVIAVIVALLAYGLVRRVRTVRAHYGGPSRGRHAR